MEGGDDDDSKLFQLDDDDDDEGWDGPDLTTTAMDSGPLESVNSPPPKDITVGEEEGSEEDGMGNHPYNPNDWGDMVDEPEAEDAVETRRGNKSMTTQDLCAHKQRGTSVATRQHIVVSSL